MNHHSVDLNMLQNSTHASFSAIICVHLRESKHWDALILSLLIVEKLLCPLREPRKKMEGNDLLSNFCCTMWKVHVFPLQTIALNEVECLCLQHIRKPCTEPAMVPDHYGHWHAAMALWLALVEEKIIFTGLGTWETRYEILHLKRVQNQKISYYSARPTQTLLPA